MSGFKLGKVGMVFMKKRQLKTPTAPPLPKGYPSLSLRLGVAVGVARRQFPLLILADFISYLIEKQVNCFYFLGPYKLGQRDGSCHE